MYLDQGVTYKVYKLNDFEQIKNSDEFFARKLTSAKLPPLIKKINAKFLDLIPWIYSRLQS